MLGSRGWTPGEEPREANPARRRLRSARRSPPAAEEPVDLDMVNRIRDEGLNRSKVMETAAHLTDRIGPRLTNSPQAREASEWTRAQLAEWGLANAHLESWGPFGRGWSYEQRGGAHRDARSPRRWSRCRRPGRPGTEGAVRGPVDEGEDREGGRPRRARRASWRAASCSSPSRARSRTSTSRSSTATPTEELADLAVYGAGAAGGATGRPWTARASCGGRGSQKRLRAFFKEKACWPRWSRATASAGIVRVSGGGSREPGEDPGVPALVVAAEHYNRLARLVDREQDVEVEVDVRARFHDDDPHGPEHDRRDPGHGSPRRGGDARRAPRLLARGHRRHRQRGRRRGGHGGGAHPAGARREAAAHHPHRALDGRGAGAARLARLRARALRLAARSPTGEEKELPSFLRRVAGPAHPEAGARAARPPTSTSTTAPARSAASTPSRTSPRRPSSRPGCARSPTSGRPPSPTATPASTDHVSFDARRAARLPVHPGRHRVLDASPTTPTSTSTTACRRTT